MKHQWMVYVIVAVLSVGAGVAIAGLPDNAGVDPTVLPPATIDEPAAATTTAAATTATTASPPTQPDTTGPESTEPESTEPASTEPAPPESTIPDSTEAPIATEAPSSTEPELALPDRSEIVTVTANGANVAGTATRWSELLEELGYADVRPRDGTQIVDLSVIYYAEGFEESAVRLAQDMLLLPEFVAPLEEAPNVLDLPADVELLAYVGLDRA